MSWKSFTIEAAENCFSGYINDRFEPGNTFIRPLEWTDSAGNPQVTFQTVLVGPVDPHTTIELFLNYGRGYWSEDCLSALPRPSQDKARNFYGLHRKHPTRPHISDAEWMAYHDKRIAPQRLLLLGMAFSTISDHGIGGQLFRDRVRCQEVEKLLPHTRVFTLDDKHEAEGPGILQGRHCSGNFCDPRRLGISLSRDFGPDGPMAAFDGVQLDYFFAPSGWTQDRWRRSFFEHTLPAFAQNNWIRVGGEFWLPHTPYTAQFLCDDTTLRKALNQDYSIKIREANENYLVQATSRSSTELRRDRDWHEEQPPHSFFCLTRSPPKAELAPKMRKNLKRRRTTSPVFPDDQSTCEGKAPHRTDRSNSIQEYKEYKENHKDTPYFHGDPPSDQELNN
jgi:hypothetical protein